MKKRPNRLLSALLLCALLPASAAAQAAVVDNGGGSRLNMREMPSKESSSMGKFLTGASVNIVADAGNGWSQVTVGSGHGSMSGYMMTQYLATGDAAARVRPATYSARICSPYGTPSVVLRDQPSKSYNAVAMLAAGEAVTVLGSSGDYLIVRTAQDSVGFLAESEVGR